MTTTQTISRKLFTCTGCGAEGLDEPLESRCHCNEDGAHWVESVLFTSPPAPVAVTDERAAFETIMEKRFKDSIDRRPVKNGDGEYFAWDMQVAWIVWQARAAMQAEPVTAANTLPTVAGKVLTITLPDTSSKAFWSSGGKSEIFHPETYKRWVKEAIERDCCISRIEVKVK
ncbi:hypothetical protein UYSO10_4251 [Kosakonia radicincitans]|nr:hypothetical protein UYSO10_4251 [Kosakonia radicincitans]